jgi:hypothetical protein
MLEKLAVGLLLLCACRDTSIQGPHIDAALAADLAVGVDQRASTHDLAQTVDLAGDLGIIAEPPPSSCNARAAGKTSWQGLLRIDSYRGLYTGHSGTHEDADATLLDTIWVYDQTLVDSTNINLAMLVDTTMAGAGLPMEVPLSVGQVIELEGEFISAATAGATANGKPAAVVHFTHTPCGFSIIGGTRYH